MKQGLETRPGVRRNRPLVLILALMVGTQTGCSKHTASEQASSQEPTRSLSAAAVIPRLAPVEPPHCPTFGSFPEPSEPQEKGEHTVILKWTASAKGDAKHADAFGYCVYRAIERNERSLVLISPVAIQDTSCTDDMVATGKTYYYKVKAISAQKHTSNATDFVTAKILDQKPVNPVASLPPACRGADKTK